MKRRNVIETERKQKERREQIKTVTLTKRFLAAFLSLVFIIGIVPASLYFSVAKEDENANKVVTETLVEDADVKDEKGNEEDIKVEKNEDDNKEIVKKDFKISERATIPNMVDRSTHEDMKEVEGVIVQLNGKIVPGVTLTLSPGKVNKDEILKDVKTQWQDMPDTARFQDVVVEDNTSADKVEYVGTLNDKVYFSLSGDTDVGMEIDADEQLVVRFETKYEVTYKYVLNSGSPVTLNYVDGEYKDDNDIVTVISPQFVELNRNLLMKYKMSSDYSIISIHCKNGEKEDPEFMKKLKGDVALTADEIEGNIEIVFYIKDTESYKLSANVVNGNLKLLNNKTEIENLKKSDIGNYYNNVSETPAILNTYVTEYASGYKGEGTIKDGKYETALIDVTSNKTLKSGTDENKSKVDVEYCLEDITVNDEKINLPKDILAVATSGKDSSAVTILNDKTKVTVRCIKKKVDDKGETEFYRYLISISNYDDAVDVKVRFIPMTHLLQRIQLNCNEGIADTAGTYLSPWYRTWFYAFFYPWDGGMNYFYVLNHNNTGSNNYDFHTAIRLKEWARLEDKQSSGKDKEYMNYEILEEEPLWKEYFPDEQYVNNVYMYKTKPGYNPYTVSLKNLMSREYNSDPNVKSEFKPIGEINSTVEETLNDLTTLTGTVKNKDRKLKSGEKRTEKRRYQYVGSYYNGEPLMGEIAKGLGDPDKGNGTWKFNFHDDDEKLVYDPMVNWEYENIWYSIGRGFMTPTRNEKNQFKANISELKGNNLNAEEKSDLFELAVLKDTYASQSVNNIKDKTTGDFIKPKGVDVYIHGVNYLHHHWGDKYHYPKASGERIYGYWNVIQDTKVNVDYKRGLKPSEYPTEESKWKHDGDAYRSNRKSYVYETLIGSSTLEYTESERDAEKRKMGLYNFFPDVTDKLGFYFGFVIPEAIKKVQPYDPYVSCGLRTYQTPIGYGKEVSLDVEAHKYEYAVKYDLGEGIDGNTPVYLQVNGVSTDSITEKYTDIDVSEENIKNMCVCKNGTFEEKAKYSVTNNSIQMPNFVPMKKGYRFDGWELVKKRPGKETTVVLADGIKVLREGDPFKLTEEAAGTINKDGILTGYASFDNKKDEEKDDGLYYLFRAKWISVDDKDVMYKVKKYTQEEIGNENYLVSTLSVGRGYAGRNAEFIGNVKHYNNDDPKHNKYYYFTDEKPTKLSCILEKNKDNDIILCYKLSPVLIIKTEVVENQFTRPNYSYPVDISFDGGNGTREYAFEIKGDKLLFGYLKVKDGYIEEMYDEDGRVIPGPLTMKDNETLTIYQMKQDEKITVSGKDSKLYDVTNPKKAMAISSDSEVKVVFTWKDIKNTGLLDSTAPYLPIIVAVTMISLYAVYVISKEKRKV